MNVRDIEFPNSEDIPTFKICQLKILFLL